MTSPASRLKFFINSAVTVRKSLSLFLGDVLHNHFVNHVTPTRTKAFESPQMRSLQRPTQALTLHQHLQGHLFLQLPEELDDRNIGRKRHKGVHIIVPDRPFEELKIIGFTYPIDQILPSFSNLPSQNRLAVFVTNTKWTFRS